MATWKARFRLHVAVIKMELSGKTVHGPVLKTTQLSARAQKLRQPGTLP